MQDRETRELPPSETAVGHYIRTIHIGGNQYSENRLDPHTKLRDDISL